LVLACYLGYAGMVGAWALLDHPWRWLFVVPLGLGAIWAMGMLLAPSMLGVSDGSDADLDERQIQARNRAYLWAYRTLGASVMLAALYYMIATERDGGSPEAGTNSRRSSGASGSSPRPYPRRSWPGPRPIRPRLTPRVENDELRPTKPHAHSSLRETPRATTGGLACESREEDARYTPFPVHRGRVRSGPIVSGKI